MTRDRRGWMLLLLLALVLLVACAPVRQIVVVTATPESATATPNVVIVTATPAPVTATALPPTATAEPPTPTREVWLHAHDQCSRTKPIEQCVVNVNPQLLGPMTSQTIYPADGSPRVITSPAGWKVQYRWGAQCVMGDFQYGSEAQIPNVPSVAGKIRIRSSWVSGCIDVEGQVDTLRSQRYLVKTTYEWSCINDLANSLSAFIGGTLFKSDGTSIALGYKPLSEDPTKGAAIWVIEPGASENALRLRYLIPFGICGEDSLWAIDSIEVLAVPQTYGTEADIWR